jgi:hypothetical protein
VSKNKVDGSRGLGYSGINKRIIMETKELERIADALEEILRLVKKDMEPVQRKWSKDEIKKND